MTEFLTKIRRPIFRVTPLVRISFCVLLAGTIGALADWNQIMRVVTLTPPVTPAPVTTRVAAIVQAAVFDALNGIARLYAPTQVHPADCPNSQLVLEISEQRADGRRFDRRLVFEKQ